MSITIVLSGFTHQKCLRSLGLMTLRPPPGGAQAAVKVRSAVCYKQVLKDKNRISFGEAVNMTFKIRTYFPRVDLFVQKLCLSD